MNRIPSGAHVALLRGVNVGGHNKVAMADLRDLATRLKLGDARTILQSGNLVFTASGVSASELERVLHAETARRFGLDTKYFVRTATEWRAIVSRNPFTQEARRDPARLVVMCLGDAPAPAAVKALKGAIDGPEVVRADGRHLYIVYPSGQGTSRLTGALIERTLRTHGTARNWNTVMKLAALVGG